MWWIITIIIIIIIIYCFIIIYCPNCLAARLATSLVGRSWRKPIRALMTKTQPKSSLPGQK